MREEGIVIGIEGEEALVQMEAGHREACGSCRMCKDVSGRPVLPARIIPGIVEGQKVVIEIPEMLRLRSILLVFVAPLAAFLAGILILQAIMRAAQITSLRDELSVAAGTLLLGAWFVVLYFIERKARKDEQNIARIVAVYPPAGDDGAGNLSRE